MLRRLLAPGLLSLGIIGLLSTAAYGAVDKTPTDSTWGLFGPVWEALVAGRYVLVLALLVIFVTGLLRKFGSPTSWVHTTWGGTLLALATSTASALTVTLAAPSAVVTASILWTSLVVGVSASGGYVVIKNLLIDPILRPLSLKAPAWTAPIFAVIFYIFDKPQPDVIDITMTAPTRTVIADANLDEDVTRRR